MSEHETDPIDEDIIDDDDSIIDDEVVMPDDEIAEDESGDVDVVDELEDDVESELDSDSADDFDMESEIETSDEIVDDLEAEIESENEESDLEAELESELDEDHEHDFYDELPVPQEATADELDIDAALAAVSQLTLLTQDEPIDYSDESDYEPAPEDTIQEFTRNTQPDYTVEFEQPRDISMSRGQMASVIPALTLIILGGWLTFTLTTSNTPPSTGLLFSVILIAVGAIFLSQWLTSARWSRGNFFFGSSLVLIGGLQLYFSQVSPDMLYNGWTLWIVALGIALFATGYIAVPRLPRLTIMGVVTIVAGAIGYVLTSGTLDPTVITFVSNLWFVGVAIVIFMMIAPLLRRRQ